MGSSGSSLIQGTYVSETSLILISASERQLEVRQPARIEFGDEHFLIVCFIFINVYRFTLCVLLLIVLSVNSSDLFEVAATDFIVATAATHHVLTRPLENPWPSLNSFTPC
jgi:hypothetical protein